VIAVMPPLTIIDTALDRIGTALTAAVGEVCGWA
jgi:hypothetical protein